MAQNVDFERKLLVLANESEGKLTTFLLGTIEMYLEYVNVHGHSEESAKWSAINEMIEGTRAMVELSDAGEL